jgi:hypothetical protein
MEADWSVEIGAGLAEIHVPWEGFIDLRSSIADLLAISEAARFPALAKALTALNDQASSLFTAKCDVWTMDETEIDRYEFAAAAKDAQTGVASYVDVLECLAENFASVEFHERRARQLANSLRGIAINNGRVDLVIRPARVNDRDGYGITVYAAGCGSDSTAALAGWESVLTAAVLATIKAAGTLPPPAPLTGE